MKDFCRIADDVTLGENVKIHSFVNLYGCRIGDRTKIGTFVEIQKGAVIGRDCKISSHTFICEGVTIEDGVFVGHNVTFINDKRPVSLNEDGTPRVDKQWDCIPTLVKKGASIGSGCTILCGVTIGVGALIGAGSVVMRSVPSGEVWVGHPAEQLRKKMGGVSKILLLLTLLFAKMPSAARDLSEKPIFALSDPGTEDIVQYEKYGVFENTGTPRYLYKIMDRKNLSNAMGEGIYPNTSLLTDPAYKKSLTAGKLQGRVWDHVDTPEFQKNFYVWASSHENPGSRQYYVSLMLKRAGLTLQAVKSFYACAVQFPKTIDMTYWKTPWYPAVTALDQVRFLLRTHPELGMVLADARIRIENKFEEGMGNKTFYVNPGRIIRATREQIQPRRFDTTVLPVKRQLGSGAVYLRQYTNNHWMLFVENAPYVVRGLIYQPSPVGKTPDNGSLTPHRDWMFSDIDKNGKVDGPYDAWVDKNHNDRQDPEERPVGDFQLLKEMGVNTIRLYHHGYSKALLSDLYKTYGIRIMMGDYAGAYAIGSDATWEAGTDYSDPQQQARMLHSIREMVEEYKEEPYILFWVLGNENNFGVANNSRKNPDAYYQFINRAALMIKSLDSNHPVAICNGDLGYLNKIKRFCPDIDILGVNAYRGDHGFGDSFWQDAAEEFDKPVVLTEFGCPAYNRFTALPNAEEQQAAYLKANWQDIEWNLGGGAGAGNALGGVLFEWLDEWWKAGPPPKFDPAAHDTAGQFGGPFPDGWSHEEWFGIASQGSGQHSPFERQLRKAYFVFKEELWNRGKMSDRGLPPDPAE